MLGNVAGKSHRCGDLKWILGQQNVHISFINFLFCKIRLTRAFQVKAMLGCLLVQ